MDNQLHRRTFSLRRILTIPAIVFVVAAVLAGFAIYALSQATKGVGEMLSPAEVEVDEADIRSVIGTALPIYVTDFHAKGYNFMQSRIIAMRVTIPSARLNDFLNVLGFEEPLQDRMNTFRVGHLPEIQQYEWWKPDAAISYSGGSRSGSEVSGDSVSCDILVDKTLPEQYVVYLIIEQG